MRNRLEDGSLDAALHLLDRQVVDVDDLHVCKVDDLEVTFDRDGPRVTRILTGPAALVPRLSSRSGHWLRERWISLGIQYADRDVPLALGFDVVDELGSAIRLSVSREGLLDRQPPPPPGVERRRMGELLGVRVVSDHDELRGQVLDLRLAPRGDALEITHLVVGPGRPGSLLGYDRGDFDGPWMVNAVVTWLHRHLRAVPWSAVEHLDWDGAAIRLAGTAEVGPARGHPNRDRG